MDAESFKDQVPDSLHFKTRAGRQVFGGGGIVPDFIVQEDTSSSPYLFNFMLVNRIDFNFVRDYIDQNGDELRAEWEDDFQAFRSDFEWTEEDKNNFLERMKSAGLELADELDEPEVEGNTLRISQEMYNDLIWMNFGRMKAEVARQIWGNEYFYPIVNDYFNESLKQAMKLWNEVEKLEAYASKQAGLLQQQ
jgi:carboxyl-terminal processing protease